MKHITKAVFETLVQGGIVDFLFFTASSFKLRFGDLLAPEIRIPNSVSCLEIHRALADQDPENGHRAMSLLDTSRLGRDPTFTAWYLVRIIGAASRSSSTLLGNWTPSVARPITNSSRAKCRAKWTLRKVRPFFERERSRRFKPI